MHAEKMCLQQILAVEVGLSLRSESACGGRSPGHRKGRAEKLGGELAVWKVRMLMLLWEAARLLVMFKVMIGLMQRGDVSWPLHFLKCACGWKQITTPSKFTCKEIYHTKGSLCRCSISISLITDTSRTLSQKAPLLSISAQCTGFIFSVNITQLQLLKTFRIKLTSPINALVALVIIFFFFARGWCSSLWGYLLSLFPKHLELHLLRLGIRLLHLTAKQNNFILVNLLVAS